MPPKQNASNQAEFLVIMDLLAQYGRVFGSGQPQRVFAQWAYAQMGILGHAGNTRNTLCQLLKRVRENKPYGWFDPTAQRKFEELAQKFQGVQGGEEEEGELELKHFNRILDGEEENQENVAPVEEAIQTEIQGLADVGLEEEAQGTPELAAPPIVARANASEVAQVGVEEEYDVPPPESQQSEGEAVPPPVPPHNRYLTASNRRPIETADMNNEVVEVPADGVPAVNAPAPTEEVRPSAEDDQPVVLATLTHRRARGERGKTTRRAPEPRRRANADEDHEEAQERPQDAEVAADDQLIRGKRARSIAVMKHQPNIEEHESVENNGANVANREEEPTTTARQPRQAKLEAAARIEPVVKSRRARITTTNNQTLNEATTENGEAAADPTVAQNGQQAQPEARTQPAVAEGQRVLRLPTHISIKFKFGQDGAVTGTIGGSNEPPTNQRRENGQARQLPFIALPPDITFHFQHEEDSAVQPAEQENVVRAEVQPAPEEPQPIQGPEEVQAEQDGAESAVQAEEQGGRSILREQQIRRRAGRPRYIFEATTELVDQLNQLVDKANVLAGLCRAYNAVHGNNAASSAVEEEEEEQNEEEEREAEMGEVVVGPSRQSASRNNVGEPAPKRAREN